MGKEAFVDLLRLESSVYVHTMYSEYSNTRIVYMYSNRRPDSGCLRIFRDVFLILEYYLVVPINLHEKETNHRFLRTTAFFTP